MGKTRMEVEEMLKGQDVLELNLNERKSKYAERYSDDDELRIYE